MAVKVEFCVRKATRIRKLSLRRYTRVDSVSGKPISGHREAWGAAVEDRDEMGIGF